MLFKKNTLLIFTVSIGFIAYSITMILDGLIKLDVMTIATGLMCVVFLWTIFEYRSEVHKAKVERRQKHTFTYGATVGVLYYGYKKKNISKSMKYKTIEELKKMNPYAFEDYIAAIYKKLGYSVIQTKKSGDGGKDIIIRKDGAVYYVECKRYEKAIDSKRMRDFIGACVIDGDHIKGIYVTTSHFTKDAIITANKKGIELVYGSSLDQLIKMANNI